MASRVLLSVAKNVCWLTPDKMYSCLDSHYHFTVDCAADKVNSKCSRFYSKENSFLSSDVSTFNPSEDFLFCNPPYGRDLISWMKKFASLAQLGVSSLLILPARVDTQWFHQYVYKNPCCEYAFLPGRIHFVNQYEPEKDQPAAFPTMLVHYRGKNKFSVTPLEDVCQKL